MTDTNASPPALTQADRTTSVWYLYNLAGDRTAYKTAKYLLSEGFIPHGLDVPIRPWPGAIIRWTLLRNRIKVPLTPNSYRATLGRRRRGRKTSHTRTSQGELNG